LRNQVIAGWWRFFPGFDEQLGVLMEGQMAHIHDSGTVSCFCDEMRAPFDGTLPEISVYFANKQAMNDALALLIAHSYLPASTMQREGSGRREVVSSKYSAHDLVKLIENGRHILLKKTFGLPDIGLGVLEESVRIDFRPGPEWSDAQINRLAETLRLLRGKVSVADICLDEMEEHFSRDATSGFQELLEAQHS
jgi:hypothetical protein